MSSATIQDLLSRLCPGVKWDMMPICMPLVTQLAIISPDDVIGFGTINPLTLEVRCIVIKNRDWESNAQWTGMSADMYNTNAVDEQDAVAAIKELLQGWGACISYSGRLMETSLVALGLSALVVPVPKFARFAEVGRIPSELKQRFADEGEVQFFDVAKAIAKTASPRMLSRAELERRLSVPRDPDARPALPVVDTTLLRDTAIIHKCLTMPAVIDAA